MTPPSPTSHHRLCGRTLAVLVSTTALLACDRAPESEPPPPIAAETANAAFANDSRTARHEREWIYPLVSFRSEHPSLKEVTGKPRPQLVDLPGGRQRAIVGNASHRVRVAVPDLASARVGGTLALLPGNRGKATAKATFSIAVIAAPSAIEPAGARRVLSSHTLSVGDFEDFEIVLPNDLGPGARIELALDFPKKPPRAGALAAWIDPQVRKAVPQAALHSDLPNLILITSDTTRFDELGVNGGLVATPNLDKLAAMGVVFENAHSAAYGTTPSHASLMSSLPAARHRVYDNETILDATRQTLAEQVAAQGYRTAAFVGAAPLARSLGIAQGFDLYDDCLPFDPRSRLGHYTTHERDAGASIQRLGSWIRESPGSPFFAWLHVFDAHQPYSAPADYAAPYRPAKNAVGSSAEVLAHLTTPEGEPKYLDAAKLVEGGTELIDAISEAARAEYRGEIAYIDHQLGELWTMLEEQGLFERTIIVFTADHGENFSARAHHLAFNHAGLHGEVTRLPLIIKAPVGTASAGARREMLVSNLDLAPTLVGLLGIDADSSWEGRSVLAALNKADAAVVREHIVLEGPYQHEIAVRTPHWLYREVMPKHQKSPNILAYLGYEPGQPFELYDLAADPNERTNVYAEDHPALESLRAVLADHLSSRSLNADNAPERVVSPEHSEALRALGYVE